MKSIFRQGYNLTWRIENKPFNNIKIRTFSLTENLICHLIKTKLQCSSNEKQITNYRRVKQSVMKHYMWSKTLKTSA